MTPTDRVILVHDGNRYDPLDPEDDWSERGITWDGSTTISPDVLEHRDRLVREGTLTLPSGEPMPDLSARRVKALLLGTYNDVPAPTNGLSHRSGEPRAFLIPGLWPWGHIPMLGGPPKAGKTTLIADLAASLLVPGRRFLDYFEPATRTIDEFHGDGLWTYIIQAETPAEDFEAALIVAGVMDDTWLTIDHLESAFGGASAFDVRKPEVYDMWLHRLIWCERCDGSDFAPPSVLIVDGLTAILGGDTAAYGAWYAAFRQLMREAGIPNALVTAHNGLRGKHLMNGVESMAQADGLWNYFTDDPDGSNPARYFSVTPRLGGVPIPKARVRFEEGRLRMRPNAGGVAGAKPQEQPSEKSWAAETILSKLTEAGDAGIMTTALTGRGRVGNELRAALDALHREARVVARAEGIGQRWFLAEKPPAG